MTAPNYATINPIVIDCVVNQSDATVLSIPMYFGSLIPCDLYWGENDYYLELAAAVETPCIHGKATTILPAPNWPSLYLPDDSVSLTVRKSAGTFPPTCTEDQFLAGQNYCFVGNVGRWEKIFYKTLTDNGDGTFTLSRIIRAQSGTWYAGYRHAANDSVVFGTTGLVRFDRPFYELGKLMYTNVVPRGAPARMKTGLQGNFYVNGDSVRQWPPINPHAHIVGSDLVFSWDRVDRSGGSFVDRTDYTPLTDGPDSYTLCIYKLPTLTTDQPIRYVEHLLTNSYTYLAADMATDGTSTDTEFAVMIMQESALSGKGIPFYGNVSIEV